MSHCSAETQDDAHGYPTSLVTLETCDIPLRRFDTPLQRKLHWRWERERTAVIEALLNGNEKEKKRAERIQGCCSHPQITFGPAVGFGVRLFCCRDRMCSRCSVGRAIENAKRIGAAVGAMNAPRQIELTIKHREAGLSAEIDRLWKAFKALRRSSFWKNHVKGGIGVLEVTLNEKTRLWHPHLHLVVDGAFMPQALLSAAWHEATGDSQVVYIQAVNDRAKTASYVAKYLAKSAAPTSMHGYEIREYAAALHGRRLVFGFGTYSKWKVDPKPETEACSGVSNVLLLQRLIDASAKNMKNAAEALHLLSRSCSMIKRLVIANASAVLDPQQQLSEEETKLVLSVIHAIQDENYKVSAEKPLTKRQRRRIHASSFGSDTSLLSVLAPPS